MFKIQHNTPRFLSTDKCASEWPCTSTGPVWKLRKDQIINMNSHFCLVFLAPAKWRVELRAKIGHYRNRFFTGGHLIIGRTQLSDVASFRALQTRIFEIWIQCRQLHEQLKTHRKNCQITTNNKQLTVKNVHSPFPSTICTYGGIEELQNLKLFF